MSASKASDGAPVFSSENRFGCIAPSGEKVAQVNTSGGFPNCKDHPDDPQCMYPCMDHKTMVDVLGSLSWKYYIQQSGSLWDAPAAVLGVCGPNQPPPNGTECDASTYTNHVILPNGDRARIMTDIESPTCGLAAVSWVIPDGKWSDHAGQNQGHPEVVRDGGPSWVGRIINALGNSTCTDRIGDQDVRYWNDTVILVVWDDWGGWYDHVSPASPTGPGIGYSNGDSGWYVHGFRVPLLVISAYNKHTNGTLGYTGYVSGPPSNPDCRNTDYCHDFGSILNFIEFVFGSGGSYLGSIGDDHSSYADSLAPDAKPTCVSCDYALSDFFNFDATPNTFNPITSFKYQETCFHNPDQPGCWPECAG